MSKDDLNLVHRNHFQKRYGEHLTQDVFNDNVLRKVEDDKHRDHYNSVMWANLGIAAGLVFVIFALALLTR